MTKAVWFWALALIASAALAVTEDNAVAGATAAAMLPLFPGALAGIKRIGLLLSTGFVLVAGEPSLLLAAPLGFALAGLNVLAVTSAVTLVCAAFGVHHLQSTAAVLGERFHVGSYAFILIPVATASLAAGARLGWRSHFALLVGGLALGAVAHLGVGDWISVEVFTSPLFRTGFALAPTLLAALAADPIRDNGNVSLTPALIACAIGAAAVQLVPRSPVTAVVFDEAHGRWETTLAPFGPDSFGRSAMYTYRLLRQYAERLVGQASALMFEADDLPPTSSVFILKMPTRPIGETFAIRLEDWVRRGGRLMIVADHTDLYDTTQNLNHLLERFHAQIRTDSVFDYRGMPTSPLTPRFASVLGRVDSLGTPISWQTGASLALIPANALELATFGLSFSEPGDYSGPNRFGPFRPRLSLRYFRHTALTAFAAGQGAVAIVLDSTPWSTFSVFRHEYLDLFRGLIHALSEPTILLVCGWGVLALGIVACLLIFSMHAVTVIIASLLLGVILGAGSRIALASHSSPIEGRDFTLRVAAGSSAKLEFLPQLVMPGERNYSRIVSSIFKYGLNPTAARPGSEVPELRRASQWLLIEPDFQQLPPRHDVIEHLSRGGNLTVLFAPDQARQAEVRNWLAALGMTTQGATALAVAEDARPGEGGLLERRGPVLLRDSRAITAAFPHSLFKVHQQDQFVQSYTVRPSQVPRRSGFLNVGFSADQFSDAAVGDVWEGVHPSSVGKLRERQLAAVLLGKELATPFPDDLIVPKEEQDSRRLTSYVLLVNGATVLSGDFQEGPSTSHARSLHAPIDDPVGYLNELRGRALHFVRSHCPKVETKTQCARRMMGPDMIEWMVAWVADSEGTVIAVELLHERRFSGLGRTLNVLFAQ